MPEQYKPVRLSLIAAAREFGVARSTLRNKLTNVTAGDDDCYSIAQIASALYTDLTDLKAEEIRERTKHWRLKNEVAEGNLLNKADLEYGMEMLHGGIRAVIDGSNLSNRGKEGILESLCSCFDLLDEVADKQRKEFGTIKKAEEKGLENEEA